MLPSRWPLTFGVVGALTFIATVGVQAQTIISNEKLVTTTFVVDTSSATAKCVKAGCAAQAPILTAIPVNCPAAIGGTCTFHIALDSRIDVALPCLGSDCTGSSGARNSYQFLVDGKPPVPGPTDAQGYYVFAKVVWSVTAFPSRYPFPATIVASVTNISSQDHTIDVNLQCVDVFKFSGCGLIAASTTMRVDVFEP
jgi:hypothetical protein